MFDAINTLHSFAQAASTMGSGASENVSHFVNSSYQQFRSADTIHALHAKSASLYSSLTGRSSIALAGIKQYSSSAIQKMRSHSKSIFQHRHYGVNSSFSNASSRIRRRQKPTSANEAAGFSKRNTPEMQRNAARSSVYEAMQAVRGHLGADAKVQNFAEREKNLADAKASIRNAMPHMNEQEQELARATLTKLDGTAKEQAVYAMKLRDAMGNGKLGG